MPIPTAATRSEKRPTPPLREVRRVLARYRVRDAQITGVRRSIRAQPRRRSS